MKPMMEGPPSPLALYGAWAAWREGFGGQSVAVAILTCWGVSPSSWGVQPPQPHICHPTLKNMSINQPETSTGALGASQAGRSRICRCPLLLGDAPPQPETTWSAVCAPNPPKLSPDAQSAPLSREGFNFPKAGGIPPPASSNRPPSSFPLLLSLFAFNFIFQTT